MQNQDTSPMKEKILLVLKKRGPSLPVRISNEVGLSTLFASAFLSELISEKKIKISNMKVGNSPLYFLPGQENMLENFSEHLNSKEKEAFKILNEKKFIVDEEQEPSIRMALRELKDFAVPFKKNEKIIWRYFTIPESEFEIKETPKKVEEIQKKIEEKTKIEELNIFDKEKISKPKKKIRIVKKSSEKKNEKFFNKIKEFLSSKAIEILDIEGFSKTDLTLKVRENGEKKILVAYNKKRVTEKDITKAHKKARDYDLRYLILSLGEPLKKLTTFISSAKNLSSIEKVK